MFLNSALISLVILLTIFFYSALIIFLYSAQNIDRVSKARDLWIHGLMCDVAAM